MYGKELVLDLHDCDTKNFTREGIKSFMDELCEEIDMEQHDLHFWDDLHTPEEEKETDPNLVGTSAIQFITTSNITIHSLDLLKAVYLNIFSCKDFDKDDAIKVCLKYFGGTVKNAVVVERV